MLFGYARVSSAEQNPAHQVDALVRAGVEAENIHLDHAGGAKAPRPQLDAVLARLRGRDTLVITRLDRFGRSVLHLITLRGAAERAQDRQSHGSTRMSTIRVQSSIRSHCRHCEPELDSYWHRMRCMRRRSNSGQHLAPSYAGPPMTGSDRGSSAKLKRTFTYLHKRILQV
ncbi:MAG: recombinase family protein [Rhodococcus sp. (in: high G+C Gram-positive bacteria)]|nr:recombinase family protein [Rhodococcus sp. (in: high G+C Gram-positive bacteria)]